MNAKPYPSLTTGLRAHARARERRRGERPACSLGERERRRAALFFLRRRDRACVLSLSLSPARSHAELLSMLGLRFAGTRRSTSWRASTMTTMSSSSWRPFTILWRCVRACAHQPAPPAAAPAHGPAHAWAGGVADVSLSSPHPHRCSTAILATCASSTSSSTSTRRITFSTNCSSLVRETSCPFAPSPGLSRPRAADAS